MSKTTASKAVLIFLLITSSLGAAITTETLLDELTDLQRLARLPDPPYVTRQFSSYDRASRSPTEDWFANGDFGQYLRIEEVNGRKEHVMMDADGPGAIVRIWSANPQGVLRIYIDRNPEPVIEAPMSEVLGGTVPGLPVPLAGVRARGWNLYFPIPYATHCKVTSDHGGFYYHVNYRTWPAGTEVVSFRPADLVALRHKIYGTAARLLSIREDVPPPADRQKQTYEQTLAPGAEAVLWTGTGPRAIVGFLTRLAADDLEAAARAVVLDMTFDGQQTVECPIGDFYGTAPGLNPYASVPMGITVTDAGTDLWSHWWMPFAREARIRVRNLGRQEVRLSGGVSTVPWTWDDRSLLFHAGWRIERDLPTRPFSDWVHLECKGQGRFVGGHLHVQNPYRGWWGEGDEKIYVDGEPFPSHFGTGTEDYYGYAWCCNERFVHAFHNQPRCDGPANYGNSSVNRFHIIDDIPFTRQFKFDIENWHSVGDARYHRAAVSYWYARPGGSSFFRPLTAEDVRLDVIEPFKVFRVPGAQEGESLPIVSKTAGRTTVQGLGGGNRWSNEQHLWWTDAGPGAELTVAFEAPEAGRRAVAVNLTKAEDYAQVQLLINGREAGGAIDLYHDGVTATGPIELGEFELEKGRNLLTIRIVGANEAAKKSYMFGLDYVLVR